MAFQIKNYSSEYHDSIYDICLKTGNSGKGAEHLYDDPMILGHIYAGPYINLEPESAFILHNNGSPCGYIIGALDTQSFFNKVNLDWLPTLQQQYSEPSEDSKPWNKDDKCIHLLFHPEKPEDLPDYPSHLHIDLLPIAQGKGQGKILMDHFMQYLESQGSRGVHLGLGIQNERALHFYKKYGMIELKRNSDSIIMGLSFE